MRLSTIIPRFQTMETVNLYRKVESRLETAYPDQVLAGSRPIIDGGKVWMV